MSINKGDIDKLNEDDLSVMYESVLDSLLISPTVKKQLISEESAEKKKQTLLLHRLIILMYFFCNIIQ